MSLSASARVEQIKLAIDAKLTGGAVKAISFPDGKSLQNMTLAELQEALIYWEGRAAEDADEVQSPRGLRISPIKLGSTP